jgi:hypothetical protein
MYADSVGARECKTCKEGKISVGTRCTKIVIDDSHPRPRNVRIQRFNATTWDRIRIEWTVDAGVKYTAFVVKLSTTKDFVEDPTTLRTIDLNYDTTHIVSTTIAGSDVRDVVHYAKVMGIDSAITKESKLSESSAKWLSRGELACSQNTAYLNASATSPHAWSCEQCPRGGDCSGSKTFDEVGPKFGWWRIPPAERDPAKPEVFAECMFAPACLGAANPVLADRHPEARETTASVNGTNCNENLGFRERSRLCHSCADNHRRLGLHRCAKCPKNQGENWGLILLGVFIAIVVLVYLVTDSIKVAGTVVLSASIQKIFLNYLQVVALCQNFPLRWPAELEWLFEVQGAISTLGEHMVNADCLTSSTDVQLHYSKQLAFALAPCIIVALSFVVWFLIGIKNNAPICAKRSKPEDTTSKDKFVVTVTTVCYLIYPTLCKNAFGLFDCKWVGDRAYLVAAMEEPCYVGQHLVMLWVLGVGQIIVYVIGLPLVVLVFLRRNRENLDQHVPIARYGLFYAAYKPTRFFWETVLTARKVAIVTLSVFGPTLGTFKQAQMALLILVVCMVVEIYGDPYLVKNSRYRTLGHLEIASLTVAWWTMWSGLYIYQLDEDDGGAVVLTVTVIFANISMIAWFVGQFSIAKIHERKLEKQRKTAKHAAQRATLEERSSFHARLASAASKYFFPNSQNSDGMTHETELVNGGNPLQAQNPLFGEDVPAESSPAENVNENVSDEDGRIQILRADGGRRYSWDPNTGTTEWVDPEPHPVSIGGVNAATDDGGGGGNGHRDLQIIVDPTSGRHYSYNPTTRETEWVD